MSVRDIYRDRASLGHLPVLKGQTLMETPYRLQADANTLDLWNLSEGFGVSVKDSAAAAKHGTITDATWNTGGPWGVGLTYDAAGEKVQVDGSAQVGTGDFTLECVGYHVTVPATSIWNHAFFSSANVNAPTINVLEFGIRGNNDATNKGKFCIAMNPAGSWLDLYSASRYDDSVVRYFVAVIDRATPLTTLYVDGVSVGSSAINYGANSLSHTYGRLGNRGCETGTTSTMYGGLYLVRISNIARTAADILTNAKLMGFA
jgi:hypothetical protein